MRAGTSGSISTCPTAQSSPQTFTNSHRVSAFPRKWDAGCIAELPDNTIVNFDVGGYKCWTSAGTLKSPNIRDGESFFSKLVKASWHQGLKVLDDGEILVRIDRHGYAFNWIIDYLRCGGIPPLKDTGLLDSIRHEADFYGLFVLRDLAAKMAADIATQVVDIRKSDQLEYLCKAKMIQSGVIRSTPKTPPPLSPPPAQNRISTPSRLPRCVRHFTATNNSPIYIEDEDVISTARSHLSPSPDEYTQDESPLDESSRSLALLMNDVPFEDCEGAEPMVLALVEVHGRDFSTNADF